SSLEKAKSWVKELQRQANPNIVISLVGNKLDLLGDTNATDRTSGAASADELSRQSAETGVEAEIEGVAGKSDSGEGADQQQQDHQQPQAEPSSVHHRHHDDDEQPVDRPQAIAYAQESGLLFGETSAKTNVGVQEVFNNLAKRLPLEQMLAERQSTRNSQLNRGAVDVNRMLRPSELNHNEQDANSRRAGD
ncbi:Vacuolar protein sorting-associated protein 21, partial [Spiromyces aspiralis]